MNKNYLLQGDTALEIYDSVKNLPIIDYHCHLSPEEIFLDRQFDNIGEMWLGGDHYKWRLMRTAGIDEEYITGSASWHDKFIKYAEAIELAAGNPLYHWSHMELSRFFGIDDPLNGRTAESIWQRANEYIKNNHLSPRKLIEQSGVEVICTTDDITDDLHYHAQIRNDNTFKTKVIPSFRTDNLLLVRRNGYLDYLKKLSETSKTGITGLDSFKKAVEKRLEFFVENGCKFTDVGMPFFPNRVSDDTEAAETFEKILCGRNITDREYLGFIGNMYLFLGRLYKQNNLVMQWHLAVYRNANSSLFEALGADCGVDCVGDTVSGNDIINMLDAINVGSGLPQTVIYTLNSANAAQIASIAGAFPGVRCGAAWWFCDHKRGIEEEINIIAENSALGTFLGMLTDSRSFLSYARHDYFRRILSNMIAKFADGGEYDPDSAKTLVSNISYYNIKNLIGE